ncbi:MAG TPA: DUF6265 family protein [Cyclobacteriaceae bacterium]|nr:DUF6265 family protein [Cyclobacteriaceae bacterium]
MRFNAIIVLMFVATAAYSQAGPVQDLKKLEWLKGDWTRTNQKPGRSGYETWKSMGPTTMIGRGVMMKGSDTTFVEKIRIELKEGKMFYVADVPENKGEVWFEFTQLKDNGFVCENPKHDFPKKISYEVDGKNMKATISDDKKSIDYLFIKQ